MLRAYRLADTDEIYWLLGVEILALTNNAFFDTL